MKLVSFSARKYRSIKSAEKLPIKDVTILIGPNNEGKSNILRALVTTLRVISGLGTSRLYRGRIRHLLLDEEDYDWERDFPVSLQSSEPDGESVFQVEFELTADEINEFKAEVGSNLNGLLPIQITIGRKEPGFRVVKRGPGARALTGKSAAIATFIGKRLSIQYIPAVRTSQSAQRVVDDIVNHELRVLARDAEFAKALTEIERLQKPVLKRIASSIKETLTEFLPGVSSVSVTVSPRERFVGRGSCEIIVDDGTPTALKHKGDGVQSLAALSLMRRPPGAATSNPQPVLALEEPESHLHPRAIHQLRDVLLEMASRQQLIMTTHCPLFVNRQDIKANIIVTDTKATPARNLNQIRDTLGVRAADNLKGADLVLLVEGEDDRAALLALLAESSPTLATAIKNGRLAIDSLLGSGKLSYKLTQLKNELCATHSFVDFDKAGEDAVERAEKEGLLTTAEFTFARCSGMRESELEDFYDVELYKERLLDELGLDVTKREFRENKKWSDRMKAVCGAQGKRWDERTARRAKQLVADRVAASPGTALQAGRRGAFDALAQALERRLSRSGA